MDDVFMDASSSDEYEEEMREFEAAATWGLKSGELVVPNGNGTYRCPFCPSRKKQAFKWKELHDHARGVGVGTRGSQTGGQHRALFNFLQLELKQHAAPIAPRVVKLRQATPKRVRADNRVVHPWVGLIYNLNSVGPGGRSECPGTGELRQQFAHFHPEQVETFWGYDGPHGVAALIFGRDMKAYGNCRSFEESFQAVQRGRRDWERGRGGGQDVTELYGWMAVEEDYYDGGKAGQFLRKKHNLKTMDELVEEKMKNSQQLQKQLQGVVDQQQEMLSRADTEKFRLSNSVEAAEQAKVKAELEMRLLEEKHREEREALRAESERVQEVHRQQVMQRAAELESQMESLKKRSEELSIKESQNDAEWKRLELEREKNQRQMEDVGREVEVRNRYQNQQRLLIEKHEHEHKDLENDIQERKLNLAKVQKLEFEVQQLQEKIETERLKAADADESSETIKKLEEELKDLVEDKDAADSQNNYLTVLHREAQEKVVEAQEAAVKVLKLGETGIAVKRTGQIDSRCWEDVGEGHFKTPDWQARLAHTMSRWDDKIKSHDWYPFKKIDTKDKMKDFDLVVDPEDPDLKKLRTRFGDKPYNGVVTALSEIEKYNASGRYPKPMPWNYAANKEASLAEVILHLGGLNEAAKAEIKRLNVDMKTLTHEVEELREVCSAGPARGRGKRKKT